MRPRRHVLRSLSARFGSSGDQQVFQGVNTHSGDNCVIKVLKPVKKKKIKREIK